MCRSQSHSATVKPLYGKQEWMLGEERAPELSLMGGGVGSGGPSGRAARWQLEKKEHPGRDPRCRKPGG